MARLLMILTSNGKMGADGAPTGFYWEELAVPYWAFREAGYTVDLASPKGGRPPADPASDDDTLERPRAVQHFMDDEKAMTALENTMPLTDVEASTYDGIFLPGGHGTMWDFHQTPQVAATVSKIHEQGGVIGAVCHGPAGLLGTKRSDGTPLLKGRKVNGFTNSEETAAGLSKVVPFLLEDELKAEGAEFERSVEDFSGFAIRDARIVTGQNPDSSAQVAEHMLAALNDAQRTAA